MSRKITSAIVSAFLTGTPLAMSNSRVVANGSGITIMRLFGNEIARKNWNGDGAIEITNAGWFSATTRERLNGIPGVHIQQEDHQWYLNGNLWDGKWIKVSN